MAENVRSIWRELASPPSPDPDSGYQRIFPDTDGYWYVQNSAGTVTRISSSGSGPAPADAKYLVQTADALLPNAQVLGSLATGVMYVATSTGVVTTYPKSGAGGVILAGGVTSTATAAGTTTLTVASTRTQIFTGTTTQICALPDATTLVLGWEYVIRNTSTDAVTVNDGGGSLVVTLAANQQVTLVCTNIGSAAGAWSANPVTGSGAQVLATAPTLTNPVISGGTINNTPIGGTTPAAGAFTTIAGTNTGAGVGTLTLYNAPSSSHLVTRSAGGSEGSPTASQSGDNLLGFAGRGYGTSGFASGGRAIFQFRAAENWTDSAQGTDAHVLLTPNGSTTAYEALTMGNSGTLFSFRRNSATPVIATLDDSGNFKLPIVGGGLYLKQGTNATFGVATLSGGTVVVSTTKVTANSVILLTAQDSSSTGVPGVSARTAGVSFTITSSNAGDSGVVGWLIVEPA